MKTPRSAFGVLATIGAVVVLAVMVGVALVSLNGRLRQETGAGTIVVLATATPPGPTVQPAAPATDTPAPEGAAQSTDVAADACGVVGFSTAVGMAALSAAIEAAPAIAAIERDVTKRFAGRTVLVQQRIVLSGSADPSLDGRDVVLVAFAGDGIVDTAPGPPYSQSPLVCSDAVYDAKIGDLILTYDHHGTSPK